MNANKNENNYDMNDSTHKLIQICSLCRLLPQVKC